MAWLAGLLVIIGEMTVMVYAWDMTPWALTVPLLATVLIIPTIRKKPEPQVLVGHVLLGEKHTVPGTPEWIADHDAQVRADERAKLDKQIEALYLKSDDPALVRIGQAIQAGNALRDDAPAAHDLTAAS